MHIQNLNKTYISEGTKDLERHYSFLTRKKYGLTHACCILHTPS